MNNRDIEIDLCGPKICNLIQLKDHSPIMKKYSEATQKYAEYKALMRELQDIMQDEMGEIILLRGVVGIPPLADILDKYNITITEPDPEDAI